MQTPINSQQLLKDFIVTPSQTSRKRISAPIRPFLHHPPQYDDIGSTSNGPPPSKQPRRSMLFQNIISSQVTPLKSNHSFYKPPPAEFRGMSPFPSLVSPSQNAFFSQATMPPPTQTLLPNRTATPNQRSNSSQSFFQSSQTVARAKKSLFQTPQVKSSSTATSSCSSQKSTDDSYLQDHIDNLVDKHLEADDTTLMQGKVDQNDECDSQTELEDMFRDDHHPDASFSSAETPTQKVHPVKKFAPASQRIQQNKALTIPVVTPGGSVTGERQQLRSVEEVPRDFQSVFKEYQYFNIIQSKVFDDVMFTDRPIVVSAPTGSGKTVIFELAIVRLLEKHQDPSTLKIVYMAPVKALCSERYRDWSEKFSPFGLSCYELTGDSTGDDYFELQNYNLILTTPEKWDSVTRRWKDNKTLIQMVKLMLIDEVHLLNDPYRGHTLEAIVSRMKTVRTSVIREAKEFERKNPFLGGEGDHHLMRFLAVSATIPNAPDIGSWLGGSEAVCHQFGEEKRPVRLRRVVLGYPFKEGTSEFRFEMNLTYKLAGIIMTYSESKPTLIFTSARKSTQFTATTLIRDCRFQFDMNTKQRLTDTANGLIDNKLRDCVCHGIGFHHAGLDHSDRRTIEDLFLRGDLRVLVSTSTLALGVNLPAHLVVIKSTFQMIAGGYKEYSESQVLQMIGRAGRPQFDTSATAVIMTTQLQKTHYSNLIDGTQQIESNLHNHLAEHLNAEIVLRTITDISIAMEWVRSTFLYVRVMKNPKHYKMPVHLTPEQIEKRLQDICMYGLNGLRRVNLIAMGEIELDPTEAGKLMARFYIAFDTMKNFAEIRGDEELSELIRLICMSRELSDIQLRRNEKTALNSLNKDKNRASIRYPLDGKVKTNEMKVNVLMQAVLSCLLISEPGLSREAQRIVQISQRISKCLVQYLWSSAPKLINYKALKNAVVLSKCLQCGIWENSEYVSKQIDRVGVTYSTSLVHSGLTSFEKIAARNPRELELIVNKPAPFGNHIRDAAAHMPVYRIDVKQVQGPPSERAIHIELTLTMANYDVMRDRQTTGLRHSCVLLVANRNLNAVVLKMRVSDEGILNAGMYRRQVVVPHKNAFAECNLEIALISEKFAGIDIITTFTASSFVDNPEIHPTAAESLEDIDDMFDEIVASEFDPLAPLSRESAPTFTAKVDVTKPYVTAKPPPPPTVAPPQKKNTPLKQTFIDTSMRLRRECRHTCVNKRTCAHDCCKEGVVAKTPQREGGGGRTPAKNIPKASNRERKEKPDFVNDLRQMYMASSTPNGKGPPTTPLPHSESQMSATPKASMRQPIGSPYSHEDGPPRRFRFLKHSPNVIGRQHQPASSEQNYHLNNDIVRETSQRSPSYFDRQQPEPKPLRSILKKPKPVIIGETRTEMMRYQEEKMRERQMVDEMCRRIGSNDQRPTSFKVDLCPGSENWNIPVKFPSGGGADKQERCHDESFASSADFDLLGGNDLFENLSPSVEREMTSDFCPQGEALERKREKVVKVDVSSSQPPKKKEQVSLKSLMFPIQKKLRNHKSMSFSNRLSQAGGDAGDDQGVIVSSGSARRSNHPEAAYDSVQKIRESLMIIFKKNHCG